MTDSRITVTEDYCGERERNVKEYHSSVCSYFPEDSSPTRKKIFEIHRSLA